MPDVMMPDALMPDAMMPDATAPAATTPDATMPDATMPAATVPDATMPNATMPNATMPNATMSDVMMWHRRLAHLHSAALRPLVNGIRVPHNREQCDVCVQAKHKQRFIRTMVKRVTKPFELVHSDKTPNDSIRNATCLWKTASRLRRQQALL